MKFAIHDVVIVLDYKKSMWDITYSRKFSHDANFRVFRGNAGERKYKKRENFYERTLELEDGPPSLVQDLCGSPPCASFAAQRTSNAPCISTNSKRITEEIVFMATRPTGIAGPLFLAKKCLA